MINRLRTALLSALLLSPLALADPDAGAGDNALDEARAQLDAAARRFAELQGVHDENVFEHAEDRAFLGLILGPVEGNSEAGLEVLGVSPGSGAEAAGVQVGDVVTQIGTENIRVTEPLRALCSAMHGVEPGEVVPVSLARDGVDSVVDVTTSGRQVRRIVKLRQHHDGDHDEELEVFEWHGDEAHNSVAIDIKGLAERLGSMGNHSVAITSDGPGGLQLVNVAEELGAYFGVTSGALVVSSNADAGLRPGDVVQAVGDTIVRSSSDDYRALAALTQPATAQVVRRQQGATTVEVRPMRGHDRAKRIERRIIREHKRD